MDDKYINYNDFQSLFNHWKEKEYKDLKDLKKRPIEINHKDNSFINDGVVDKEQWKKIKDDEKILFVLKEAYSEDNSLEDLAALLKTGGPGGRFKRTWDRVANWTYGIQNTNDTNICKYENEPDATYRNNALRQIAVLNLKKYDGKKTSDYHEIEAYAIHDKEEIKNEFELINPKIIICGSTFWHLYNCVFEKKPELENHPDDRFHWLNIFDKDRLFIDFYHPANRWPDIVNYYALLGIYQQALKAQPKSGS